MIDELQEFQLRISYFLKAGFVPRLEFLKKQNWKVEINSIEYFFGIFVAKLHELNFFIILTRSYNFKCN